MFITRISEFGPPEFTAMHSPQSMLPCAPHRVVFIYGTYVEEIRSRILASDQSPSAILSGWELVRGYQNPSISHLQLLLSRLMERRLNWVFGIAFFNCQITLYILPPSKDLETVPSFIFHSTKQKLSSPSQRHFETGTQAMDFAFYGQWSSLDNVVHSGIVSEDVVIY